MRQLNFEHVSNTDFEHFTFELLHDLGFVNLDWRKGTALKSSPADRGRDIVAYQDRIDIDKTHHLEKWFVDCKHFRKGVPPTELHNLLTWSDAERPDIALFVLSGFLSNSAKDYLDDYKRNNRPAFKIKYWEKPQLESLVKTRLIYKYQLTNMPIRNVKAIIKAENEFFTKVWYGRKDSAANYRKHGTPEDIIKGMLKAKRAAEKRFGKKNLGPWNDFEWGMLSGKLSAIRWVLGEDWDMLDT